MKIDTQLLLILHNSDFYKNSDIWDGISNEIISLTYTSSSSMANNHRFYSKVINTKLNGEKTISHLKGKIRDSHEQNIEAGLFAYIILDKYSSYKTYRRDINDVEDRLIGVFNYHLNFGKLDEISHLFELKDSIRLFREEIISYKGDFYPLMTLSRGSGVYSIIYYSEDNPTIGVELIINIQKNKYESAYILDAMSR